LERIIEIKKILRKRRKKRNKHTHKTSKLNRFSLIVDDRKKSKARQNDLKEAHFLPKVDKRSIKKMLRGHSKKLLKERTFKEFEPFKMSSAYGKFIRSQANKPKFKSEITFGTLTDYTSQCFPVCTSRGVVPSPLEINSIPEKFATKSSNMFSPIRDISKGRESLKIFTDIFRIKLKEQGYH
jgi:hypothetical protein